mmetsp:Transcript_50105/g.113733  ORF Transcript_50105/g.113733 Transcript_50105/m.113733 type:complete len:215 (-) Transcript_50105:332-976(-)
MSSGTRSSPIKSCGDKRYEASSRRCRSSPPTTRPYGSRQACAHWPRLADRPPHASELRHCPLYDTHRAPCTNASTLAASGTGAASLAALAASAPTTRPPEAPPRPKSAPPCCGGKEAGTRRASTTDAMSATESSRPTTTVSAPRRRALNTAPAPSVTDIWVEAWIGSPGAQRATSWAIPTSCTMSASTPARAAPTASRSASPSSESKTRTLQHI